ncbi:hypothetical protein EZS27_033066 [termite gut metagenome]|uniref:Uncharacterized protein n=1 Tax=termite gut metagenome TaxID=433724 RepID=A0A5J4Q4J8_9ZZZZ
MMNTNNKPAPLSDFERGRKIGRVEGMIDFHHRLIEQQAKEENKKIIKELSLLKEENK